MEAGTVVHISDVVVQKSESSTVRLVCTALSKHGSEQSGVYQPFTAYLSSHGVTQNPLASLNLEAITSIFFSMMHGLYLPLSP